MSAIEKRIADVMPPKTVMWLRGEKNRRELFGLHAPAKVLSDLVPSGRPVVDAGANVGLYAYWLSKNASVVHAFEPHPRVFAQLQAAAGPKIHTYNVALSDEPGTALLHVPPAGLGEASLIPHAERGQEIEVVPVELRTLDSYRLSDVGFLKVDVEGHEEPLLRGARETIIASRPVVFMEIEERHAAGSVDRITEWMQAEANYTDVSFMCNGAFYPLAEFDLNKHQLRYVETPSSPNYVSNFLFLP